MTLVRIKDMDMLVFIQIYDPNMIKQCTYSDNIIFEFLRINTHTLPMTNSKVTQLL